MGGRTGWWRSSSRVGGRLRRSVGGRASAGGFVSVARWGRTRMVERFISVGWAAITPVSQMHSHYHAPVNAALLMGAIRTARNEYLDLVTSCMSGLMALSVNARGAELIQLENKLIHDAATEEDYVRVLKIDVILKGYKAALTHKVRGLLAGLWIGLLLGFWVGSDFGDGLGSGWSLGGFRMGSGWVLPSLLGRFWLGSGWVLAGLMKGGRGPRGGWRCLR